MTMTKITTTMASTVKTVKPVNWLKQVKWKTVRKNIGSGTERSSLQQDRIPGAMVAQESDSAVIEQGKTIMSLNEPSPDRASSDLVQPRWTRLMIV